jgi:hypothetical protein
MFLHSQTWPHLLHRHHRWRGFIGFSLLSHFLLLRLLLLLGSSIVVVGRFVSKEREEVL